MAKMVNSWNEWDPLKRVIVGTATGTQLPAPEPAWQYHAPKAGLPLGTWGMFPQDMVDVANEKIDAFCQLMEGKGIVVDRIEPHPVMLEPRAVSTPDWTQLNMRGIANPRDLFLVAGNEIMEAPGTKRSRYYEYLNLRPIFERYFKEDPEFLWTSAPRPRLTDESYVPNYYYLFDHVWTDEQKQEKLHKWEFQLTEKEPLWDAADAMRFGKDLFWQRSSVTNHGGMDWVKRYFEPKGLRIHPVTFDKHEHPWHIDVNLVPIRPGLAMYNPDWPPVDEGIWELFKINDWELVPAARPSHYYDHPVTQLGGEYEGPSWISMNTFALGPNTVCVEAHEPDYIEQLTKLGVDVIPVDYADVAPFGGELHCTTLDVYREGELQDYFPKQVPGF
jgi:glycine amidinotransferase